MDSGDHGADSAVMKFSSFAGIGLYPRKIASLDTTATEFPTARNRMQIVRKDPDRQLDDRLWAPETVANEPAAPAPPEPGRQADRCLLDSGLWHKRKKRRLHVFPAFD